MGRCSAHMYAFGSVLQVLDCTVRAEARGPVYYMNIPDARIMNSVQRELVDLQWVVFDLAPARSLRYII
jgi:hypothetical protein